MENSVKRILRALLAGAFVFTSVACKKDSSNESGSVSESKSDTQEESKSDSKSSSEIDSTSSSKSDSQESSSSISVDVETDKIVESIDYDKLTLELVNDFIKVEIYYILYKDASTILTYSKITNISNVDLPLEYVSII